MSEITDKWKKLRQDMGNLICDVDGKTEKLEAEEKRMKEKRDESYLKGTEDMRKAVNMLYDASAVGLSSQKMEELFGTVYIPSILSQFSAIYIINGLKLFLEEKQEDFKPGDEVEVIKDCHLNLGSKYIIMPEDCQPNTNPKIYSIMNLSNFNKTWAYADHLKKTGIVHRSLTIYFRGEDK